MTGQEFEDKLNAIVADLQTVGKGKTVNMLFRNSNGSANVLPLSSDANGVVNEAQRLVIQNFITNLADSADSYNTAYAPVQTAAEAFKTASIPHQVLTDAASAARVTLQTALTADPAYQTAKTALDNARLVPAYIAARDDYQAQNVSENFSELSNAKGKYVV